MTEKMRSSVARTVLWSQITGVLQSDSRFLITSHVDPDGDNIGSQLTLLSLLESLGKKVEVIDPSLVPERYRFLPGWERILDFGARNGTLSIPDKYKVVFVLDAGKWDRIEEVATLVSPSAKVVNLDHHQSNSGFGNIALVDPEASSTCELLYDLFEVLGRTPSREQAICLYTGILTDTGGFRNPNTSPRALEVAATLVREGADPAWIWDQIWGQQKPIRILLLGEVLSSLETSEKGQIATFTLPREAWQKIGAKLEESEDFISHAMGIRGVRVAVFVREKGDGLIRVSLRSRDGVDVNQIARRFGGGGHPQAAGFRVQGSLQEVRREALRAVAEALEMTLEKEVQ